MKIGKSIKRTREDLIFDTFIYISLSFLLVVTLYPFLNVLAVSFNDAIDSLRGGITIWPREFTTYSYKEILKDVQIYRATLVSVLRTVIGTLSSGFLTVIFAYILSRKDFVFRKPLTILLIMTMYFSGGLIPVYFLMRNLGLVNSFWVYVIPTMLNAYNIILVRSYIDKLPASLVESAKIDGAGEFKILMSIIIPLSLPVIATITLFTAVAHWNDWFTTFIYNSSNKNLSTLQYELMRKLQAANQGLSTQDFGGLVEEGQSVTPNSIRAAMTIIAAGPILMVYPFLQRYFVKGLTLGGVKG